MSRMHSHLGGRHDAAHPVGGELRPRQGRRRLLGSGGGGPNARSCPGRPGGGKTALRVHVATSSYGSDSRDKRSLRGMHLPSPSGRASFRASLEQKVGAQLQLRGGRPGPELGAVTVSVLGNRGPQRHTEVGAKPAPVLLSSLLSRACPRLGNLPRSHTRPFGVGLTPRRNLAAADAPPGTRSARSSAFSRGTPASPAPCPLPGSALRPTPCSSFPALLPCTMLQVPPWALLAPAHAHAHTHAHMHMLPHTLPHMFPHTLPHTLMHMLLHTLPHTLPHTLLHTLLHTLMHTLLHMLPHTLMHTLPHTRARIYLFQSFRLDQCLHSPNHFFLFAFEPPPVVCSGLVMRCPRTKCNIQHVTLPGSYGFSC